MKKSYKAPALRTLRLGPASMLAVSESNSKSMPLGEYITEEADGIWSKSYTGSVSDDEDNFQE